MQNRFTKKSIVRENGYVVDNPTVERCAKAIDKLGEYEDAEENGLLVRLPCKVGDTVYQVAAERIYESKIKQVIYDVGHFGFDESAIGTSVFLTKGEAEQALKARDSK